MRSLENLPHAPQDKALSWLRSTMSSLRFRLFLLVLLAVVPAEADQTLAFNLSGLGVLAGLALLAAWVGSDVFVLRRLKALVRATQQLAEGDLSVRTHFPQEWGELSQLSFAFDTMAASLQDLLKQRDLAEEALQRAGVELEIRVEERTAELARANALLQEQIVRVQRAEEMLQETSRFQTAILESANYTIISISVDGTILTFNAAAQAWLGYTAHEVVGKTTPILFHDHDEVVQRAQQLSAEMGVQIEPGFEVFVAKARRGEPDEQEWTYIRKDGTRFPVLLSVTRLMNAEGEITGFLGIGSDLTERKRAEEALQKYTNELHDLYNNASCGYHSLDKDGTFLRINDTELNWLGYTRNEIVGKMKFFELLTAESLKTFWENFSQFKERGWVRDLEFQMVCKNGTILPVLLNSTTIKDASGSYVMSRSTIFDITERKRAEEQIRTLNAQLEQRVIERTAQLEVANALKDDLLVREQVARESAEASEQRYRALANAMPQIVWTATPEGWLDYYNQRWFDYTGMTLEQTQGWGWQPVLHPDDVQKCIDLWNQAVETGESYEIEYRFKRASDGEYRWHLGRAFPMRDDKGQIVKWFGTCTDIHERKSAEEERERLLEQLRREREDLAALSTVTANAISTLNLEDLLDVLLKRVVEVTQADTGVILLKENDHLHPRASIGLDEVVSSSFAVPIGQGFAGTIAATMRPLSLEDAQTDPLLLNPILKQRGIRTMLGVPLKRQGKLVGVLHVDWCSIHQASDRELHLLEITAERCTMAILNAQLYEHSLQLQERLQLQIDRMPIGCIVSDREMRVTDWNPAAEEIFGFIKEEVLGQEPCKLITPPALRPLVEDIFRQLAAGEMTVRSVNENVTKDGRTIMCQWYNTPLKEVDGTIVGMLSMAQDITERRRSEQELRRKDKLYRTLARNFPNGAVFLFDRDLRYTLAEGSGIKALGLESDSIEGKTIWEALSPEMSEMLEPVYRQALAGSATTFEAPESDQVYLVQVLPVTNSSGEIYAGMAVTQDITERKRTEAQLWRYAFYEPLTGLPNRTLFLERLEQKIERVKQGKAGLFAVLLLQVDRFDIVKYSLGHLVADQLMIGTARRLETCVKPTDLIARLGSDEFAILLRDLQDISEATVIADRIHQQLTLPFDLDGREVFSTINIGIALCCNENTTNTPIYDRPEDFLRAADMAMHHAKQLGKARHAVFNPAMQEQAVARLQLEADLRRAIEHEQFQVYYQPIVSLETGWVTGFEALVRWIHPTKGIVSPIEFIPLAEETGLISLIDRWVLREACAQLSIWQQVFAIKPSLTMSVNLSGVQMEQLGLIERLDQILRETGIDGNGLKLEITESVIMQNAACGTAMLEQLKALGVQLSIDDFGTGYSSLARLHQLPIDTLKIDRSFVSRMGNDGESLEIIRTIIKLAHSLEMDVIAEGVETPQDLSQLRSLQCEYGQGYFFSKPVDSYAAGQLLAKQLHW